MTHHSNRASYESFLFVSCECHGSKVNFDRLVCFVYRPFRSDTSRLVQSKPGQQAALANLEGVGSVLVSGATFATDSGDLSLPWLTDLASFFAVGGYEGGTEDTPPAPPAMTWNVALQDVAVRYEPSIVKAPHQAQQQQHASNGTTSKPKVKPVSAILTLAGLLWSMQPGDEEQRIVLQCLGLYCAESAYRHGDWTPCQPNHVPAMQLAKSGYSLVAQENQLQINLKPPADQSIDFFQTDISNQRLSAALNKSQLALVNTLVGQWTQQPSQHPVSAQNESASAGSSRQQPGHDHEHVVRRNPHAESEVGTVEWHGVAGEGHLKVMDGVQEDAFKK